MKGASNFAETPNCVKTECMNILTPFYLHFLPTTLGAIVGGGCSDTLVLFHVRIRLGSGFINRGLE